MGRRGDAEMTERKNEEVFQHYLSETEIAARLLIEKIEDMNTFLDRDVDSNLRDSSKIAFNAIDDLLIDIAFLK